LNSETRQAAGYPLRVLQAIALGFVALKLAYLFLVNPFMDEAYYWMWGQHPALSYYDHPPLNAWLLGLSGAVFGWNGFALRLPVLLSFAADIYCLWLLSRRISGAEWRQTFWPTLVLFLATPLLFVVSGVALPDHLLLTACLFCLYFFVGFFGARERGELGESRDLYLGALSLGLAALAKYNAAILGIAIGLHVLLRHRALLGEGRLYLAALLTIVVQAPVIIWNLTEGFASWQFILQGRHAGLNASSIGMAKFVFDLLLFLSPVLLIPIVRFVLAHGAQQPAEGFARLSFVLSTLVIVAVSALTLTLFHWNLVAYVAMLPFLAQHLRPRWLLWLQAVYGAVLLVALLANYTIAPMASVVPLEDIRAFRDESTAWHYGWNDVAAAVEAAKVAHRTKFVATSDYTTASLLAFALGDKDVVSLSSRTDNYDYWFDAQAHAGESAILVGDRFRPVREGVREQFTSLTELQAVRAQRGEMVVNVYRIYLAEGFRPR
jgi:4-amino-4-deoxy-L-arabinose transferase-like glycosyltransferase